MDLQIQRDHYRKVYPASIVSANWKVGKGKPSLGGRTSQGSSIPTPHKDGVTRILGEEPAVS